MASSILFPLTLLIWTLHTFGDTEFLSELDSSGAMRWYRRQAMGNGDFHFGVDFLVK